MFISKQKKQKKHLVFGLYVQLHLNLLFVFVTPSLYEYSHRFGATLHMVGREIGNSDARVGVFPSCR